MKFINSAMCDIAKTTAREYAKQGYNLYLAARNAENFGGVSNDITVRTQRSVNTAELDILDFNCHQTVYDQFEEKPLGVISAVDYPGDQEKAQTDFNRA